MDIHSNTRGQTRVFECRCGELILVFPFRNSMVPTYLSPDYKPQSRNWEKKIVQGTLRSSEMHASHTEITSLIYRLSPSGNVQKQEDLST